MLLGDGRKLEKSLRISCLARPEKLCLFATSLNVRTKSFEEKSEPSNSSTSKPSKSSSDEKPRSSSSPTNGSKSRSATGSSTRKGVEQARCRGIIDKEPQLGESKLATFELSEWFDRSRLKSASRLELSEP